MNVLFQCHPKEKRLCHTRRRWEESLPSQQANLHQLHFCSAQISFVPGSILFIEYRNTKYTKYTTDISEKSTCQEQVRVTKIFIHVVLCHQDSWEEGHATNRSLPKAYLPYSPQTHLKNKSLSHWAHSKEPSSPPTKTESGGGVPFFFFFLIQFYPHCQTQTDNTIKIIQ